MNNWEHNEWAKHLIRTVQGGISCCSQNIFLILENDHNLQSIRYNELSGQMVANDCLPWSRKGKIWSNIDSINLNAYLEEEYGFYYPQKVREIVTAYVTTRRAYNPIAEYFSELQWDGIKRVDTLLIDYMGAEDDEYVRNVTRKTLVAAVARVYSPGTKFDNVLVLCGKQGIGKSTLFAKLGGEYYSDSLSMLDMKDKTAAEKMQGIWIMEMPELSGMRKVEIEVVKAFISHTEDRYRSIYNQYAESHPRMGILVGSCNNPDGFLIDSTGNRRFWPVEVGRGQICSVFDLNQKDIDMIWAEAIELYKQGEPLYLNDDLSERAERIQQTQLETDPRQGIVDDYLKGCADRVCIIQIWCECFDKPRTDICKRDAKEIEQMIWKNGMWIPYLGNKSGKMRFEQYGVQRAFIRSFKD